MGAGAVAQIDLLLAPTAPVAVSDGERKKISNPATAGTSGPELYVRPCSFPACELGSQTAADCPV